MRALVNNAREACISQWCPRSSTLLGSIHAYYSTQPSGGTWPKPRENTTRRLARVVKLQHMEAARRFHQGSLPQARQTWGRRLREQALRPYTTNNLRAALGKLFEPCLPRVGEEVRSRLALYGSGILKQFGRIHQPRVECGCCFDLV